MFNGINAFILRAAQAVAVLLLMGSLPAVADTYPSKPIRMITPNSPGSGADIAARRVSERLAAALGQAVYVENLPGAGGVIGSETLIRAPKDGYTIGLVSSNYVIFPHLHKNLKFDALKDITPIASIGTTPLVLAARTSLPANSVSELMALAKQEPGKLMMGSSGNGTVLHLVGELMQTMGDFKLTHVPYRGVSAVVPDLVSGNIDIAFFAWSSVEGMVKQGRVKVLGVSSAQRWPMLPDVPPIAESLPGFSLEAWLAVIGPSGLPQSVVDRLSAEINAIVMNDHFRTLLAQDGTTAKVMSPNELREFMASEYTEHGELVVSSGVTIE